MLKQIPDWASKLLEVQWNLTNSDFINSELAIIKKNSFFFAHYDLDDRIGVASNIFKTDVET